MICFSISCQLHMELILFIFNQYEIILLSHYALYDLFFKRNTCKAMALLSLI